MIRDRERDVRRRVRFEDRLGPSGDRARDRYAASTSSVHRRLGRVSEPLGRRRSVINRLGSVTVTAITADGIRDRGPRDDDEDVGEDADDDLDRRSPPLARCRRRGGDRPEPTHAHHKLGDITMASLGLIRHSGDIRLPNACGGPAEKDTPARLIVGVDELLNTDYILECRRRYDAMSSLDLKDQVLARVFSITNSPSILITTAQTDETLSYFKYHYTHGIHVNPADVHCSTVSSLRHTLFNKINTANVGCLLTDVPDLREPQYQLFRQLANRQPTAKTQSSYEVQRTPVTNFHSPLQQALAIVSAFSRAMANIRRRAIRPASANERFYLADYDDTGAMGLYYPGMISALIVNCLRDHRCDDVLCQGRLRRLLSPYTPSIHFCPFGNLTERDLTVSQAPETHRGRYDRKRASPRRGHERRRQSRSPRRHERRKPQPRNDARDETIAASVFATATAVHSSRGTEATAAASVNVGRRRGRIANPPSSRRADVSEPRRTPPEKYEETPATSSHPSPLNRSATNVTLNAPRLLSRVTVPDVPSSPAPNPAPVATTLSLTCSPETPILSHEPTEGLIVSSAPSSPQRADEVEDPDTEVSEMTESLWAASLSQDLTLGTIPNTTPVFESDVEDEEMDSLFDEDESERCEEGGPVSGLEGSQQTGISALPPSRPHTPGMGCEDPDEHMDYNEDLCYSDSEEEEEDCD
ncbi:B69 [miniopterid betaherpesvirus 1]|uniref:mRNA export factor ICP27 homolog n=1 Tax=miniopterid betaherpesvirus 1 TaxID=3070189 RepID=I3VQ60_9BETA|nr:B69 [miniopterid betaherpesvirus 1]AFK83904.1 B69 [miniopterid betaherpesvirus 1]